jgi:hypothetical protein
MSRININEFSAQAGGLAFRANQVRTDPAVIKAAQDAWSDVKVASHSCSVLARETNAAWHRSRTAEPATGAHYPAHTATPVQDTPTRVAS